jgi:hypothetical protein
MVGRTRLFRKTGSPLISGHVRARRSAWPWVVGVVIVVAVVFVYVMYLR